MEELDLSMFANKIAKVADKYIFYFDKNGICQKCDFIEAYFLGLDGIQPVNNWRSYFLHDKVLNHMDFKSILKLYASRDIRLKVSLFYLFNVKVTLWDAIKKRGYKLTNVYEEDENKLILDIKSKESLYKFMGCDPRDEHLYDNMTVDRFMGRVVIQCETNIDDENILDHIRIIFATPFYYEHTKKFVLEHKKQILKNVLQEIEECHHFKRFETPVKNLRLTRFLILSGNEIEIRLEPKIKQNPIKKTYYGVWDEDGLMMETE